MTITAAIALLAVMAPDVQRPRALTEGLTAQQSDAEFDKTLDSAIAEIAAASRT